MTSAIDALLYAPTETQKLDDIRRDKATGRRSWKTLKGRPGVAVWGPTLEQALLDGLAEYHLEPEFGPRPSKHGFRFPNRNQFLSQFILDRTGVLRTYKQVSSRLQQLRDTCQDSTKQVKTIADLVAPPHDPCLDVIENTSAIELGNVYMEPVPMCNELLPLSVHTQLPKTLQLFSPVYLSPRTDFVLYDRGREVHHATTYLRQTTGPCLTYDTWIYECVISGSLWRRIRSSPEEDLDSLTLCQRLYTDSNHRDRKPLTIFYRFDVSGHLEDNLVVTSSEYTGLERISSNSCVTWGKARSRPYW
ncbi:hypothetical protein DFP72DRAFT_946589 [Ephemerocybe angulata]|uniref:TEA domain-containing protein n=1 Tax=Ephemerocybe angulata TaxID=980116 RepID=A0A8H6H7W8_9AGAR|nr:hypothetical protein DFP72DRAFT_946589 [Tulosesus angulatus]